MTYNSGDFAANLEIATGLTDRDGFSARRAASRRRGRYLAKRLPYPLYP